MTISLKEVFGKLIVKDEKLTLENIKTSILAEQLVNGVVSTKGKVPTFDMSLGLNQVNIAESFTQTY
jgi:hypothetical protein